MKWQKAKKNQINKQEEKHSNPRLTERNGMVNQNNNMVYKVHNKTTYRKHIVVTYSKSYHIKTNMFDRRKGK